MMFTILERPEIGCGHHNVVFVSEISSLVYLDKSPIRAISPHRLGHVSAKRVDTEDNFRRWFSVGKGRQT